MKRMLLILALVVALCGSGNAHEITTSGLGDSEQAAITAALRAAVESASGVYLYSETRVVDLALESDDIFTVSKSLISSYRTKEVVRVDSDIYRAVVTASIEPVEVKKFIKSKGGQTIDDALRDSVSAPKRVNNNYNASAILSRFRDMDVSKRYIATYEGYDIGKAGLHTTSVTIKFLVRPNPFFWEEYYRVLDMVKVESGFWSGPRQGTVPVCTRNGCGTTVWVNQSLLSSLVGVDNIHVALSAGSDEYHADGITLFGETALSGEFMDGTVLHLGRYPGISSKCNSACWMVVRDTGNAVADTNGYFIPDEGMRYTIVQDITPDKIASLPKTKCSVRSGSYQPHKFIR